MNYTLYILGSGIFDMPRFWWLLGMLLSFFCIAFLIVYTWCLTMFDICKYISHRTLKSFLGIIGIILMYYVFSFCEGKYYEYLYSDDPLKVEQTSKKDLWRIEYDKDGNTYIYY